MSKGSNRRPTDAKRYCNGHDRTYGERKPRRVGKTVYVWKDGEVVEKAQVAGWIMGIDPASGPDYNTYMKHLIDTATGKILRSSAISAKDMGVGT